MNRTYVVGFIALIHLCPCFAALGGDGGDTSLWPLMHGTPRVIHYDRHDFNADTQFWAMCQDVNGIRYFGNNDGVQIYDGERWTRVELPNKSSVRGLLVSRAGTLYVSGFNEFGTLTRDGLGQYQYHSLLGLLRLEDLALENVWMIHEVNDYIIFRTQQLLIFLRDGKAITVRARDTFTFSAVVHNTLYIEDGHQLRLFDFTTMEFINLFDKASFDDQNFAALLPGLHAGEVLAFMKDGSCFTMDVARRTVQWQQRFIDPHSRNLVLCAVQSRHDGTYYLGTLSEQVLALVPDGDQLVVKNTFTNLQDHTVLSLFESNDGNIWALLNNGLDCIEVASPITIVLQNASVFDVLMHPGGIYVATNQGLCYKERQPSAGFEKVPGLEGQVWKLRAIGDYVIACHDRGLFVLRGKQIIEHLPTVGGLWKVIDIAHHPDYYLACVYDGLLLLQADPTKGLRLVHRISGFQESCRDILQTDQPGVFWVCHGYKGVFRIKLNEELTRVVGVEHFKDKNGLPSPFGVNVCRWHDTVVFTTDAGIFTFDDTTQQFEPYRYLTQVLGTQENVRQLLPRGDTTWFVQGDALGYFVSSEDHPTLHTDRFLQFKGTFNRTMEYLEPLKNHTLLVGTNMGLYAYDLTYDARAHTATTLITRVMMGPGQERTAAPLASDSTRAPVHLYDADDGLLFYFATPAFHDQQHIQYSYRLRGLDDTWSTWQEQAYKEYTQLPGGRYTFEVKARSLLGEKAQTAQYFIEVIPPWYASLTARIGYGVLALVALAIATMMVKRRIEQERRKTQQEELEKRNVLELKLERMRLQQEKEAILRHKDQLEEDIIFKSKELANYTMLLVKKRELLTDVYEALKALKENTRHESVRKGLRELMKKININLESEEHLQVFDLNFERVHHEFFHQLKTSFPDLTQKELRLCAFIQMNLTNKEIASILNLSVRGIETARYRLRKRLSIHQDEDMVGYLEKVGGQAMVVDDRADSTGYNV